LINYAAQAIQAVSQGKKAYCKFLSANDTGVTSSHQSGIYVTKSASSILFDTPGVRGTNKDRQVRIRWQESFETDTRFIYYGQGTRNEYRITRGVPFLSSEYTGSLFVLVEKGNDYFEGYVLNTEEEINQFLDAFSLGPTETGQLIEPLQNSSENIEAVAFDSFISSVKTDFPTSEEMSRAARSIHDNIYNHLELITANPDSKLVDWTDLEYRLFRAFEYNRYGNLITQGFYNIENFISTANQVLNRRKSRAGKSLEHHLAAIFDGNNLKYEAQAVTEGNKRPDFLFPSQKAYHDFSFPTDNIITLAAKTTCKDRWRQILNEADRLKNHTKFLCTLQQGISVSQMDEMRDENVILVVPRKYIITYPGERRDQIWTVKKFVEFVCEKERL